MGLWGGIFLTSLRTQTWRYDTNGCPMRLFLYCCYQIVFLYLTLSTVCLWIITRSKIVLILDTLLLIFIIFLEPDTFEYENL